MKILHWRCQWKADQLAFDFNNGNKRKILFRLGFRARIEMLKNFGYISPKYRLSAGSDTIFVTDYRSTISVIFRKYRRYFGIYRYFYRYFKKFPDISYQSSPRTGYKICPIFFLKKKHKMTFGNLILICRQRLCFSAWLKNRGFRVREI